MSIMEAIITLLLKLAILPFQAQYSDQNDNQ